eukprot:scaffold142123_cov21-Attheya_sp.AAC.2
MFQRHGTGIVMNVEDDGTILFIDFSEPPMYETILCLSRSAGVSKEGEAEDTPRLARPAPCG